MYCIHCGTALPPDSKFCTHCGKAVYRPEPGPDNAQGTERDVAGEPSAFPAFAAEAEAEVAASAEPGAAVPAPPIASSAKGDARAAAVPPSAAAVKAPPGKPKSRAVYWLLPLLCTLLSAASVAGVFAYQTFVNMEVDRLHTEAERLALEGDWRGALDRIDAALEKRPGHALLKNDRQVLLDTMLLDDKIAGTTDDLEAKEYDEAKQRIETVKDQLEDRSGAVYALLSAKADRQEETIVLTQVKNEYPEAATLAQLTPYLKLLKPYDSEEAKAASKEIADKIVDVAHKQASEALADKNFAEALSTINEALVHAKDADKLEELKERVEAEQTAFEEAERERLESAMKAASQEDLRNRTEAVELVSIYAYPDEYGYFNIEGEIRNIATRPISSVMLYYDILDGWGDVLYSDSLYVDTEYLGVGETGTFYVYYDHDGMMDSVNVTSAEWIVH
ncbi:zinc-ribbon domain-containing protein [Paenibacillus sp.]|uniref:zinc-ribbon domain-containing protein n=1 Tax=Paenibacillus sp. TaxID=58172 RepID=UPI002D75C572|nr:zinc-ribbon domain-containing protein [Paenibacillus sp.]HZG86063.1 zinc-ribbon domain-containing protein [Paenibacillus sp.]